MWRWLQFHLIEARGGARQRLGGDAQPRRNRTAEIITLRRDAIKAGRGAKLDDDGRAAVDARSEEHTSEVQLQFHHVCGLLPREKTIARDEVRFAADIFVSVDPR